MFDVLKIDLYVFFSMGLSLSYAYNRKVNELTRVNSNFLLLFFLNIFFCFSIRYWVD